MSRITGRIVRSSRDPNSFAPNFKPFHEIFKCVRQLCRVWISSVHFSTEYF